MPYSELMIAPMRKELSRYGVQELRTVEDVERFMDESREGTALVVVNSMCGCSAGSMRPAVGMALAHARRPAQLASVFAGQDLEATARTREFLAPHPPSSPAVALFRDGALVFLLQRQEIQGRPPESVAGRLIAAFDAHCEAIG